MTSQSTIGQLTWLTIPALCAVSATLNQGLSIARYPEAWSTAEVPLAGVMVQERMTGERDGGGRHSNGGYWPGRRIRGHGADAKEHDDMNTLTIGQVQAQQHSSWKVPTRGRGQMLICS